MAVFTPPTLGSIGRQVVGVTIIIGPTSATLIPAGKITSTGAVTRRVTCRKRKQRKRTVNKPQFKIIFAFFRNPNLEALSLFY
jgi:hypothetical protein